MAARMTARRPMTVEELRRSRWLQLWLGAVGRGTQAARAAAGTDIYGHIESTLHWQVYQFLGKLLPVIYVARKQG